MKKHFTLLIFMLFTVSLIRAQKSDVYIHSDTTWADTVLINSNVFIDSNVTLTVLPGTFVHVKGYYAIFSYGTIKAIGNMYDTITFTHLDTIYHNDTLTTKGGWRGIRLLPRIANDTSFFKYCIISNGKTITNSNQSLILGDNLRNGGNIYGKKFGSVIIEHCLIHNGIAVNDGGGIFLKYGNIVKIDSSHIKQNKCFLTGGGFFGYLIDTIYITNNLFNYNTAFWVTNGLRGGQGAAIAASDSLIYGPYLCIRNNKIYNNYNVSGIIYDAYHLVKVVNNLICNNRGCGIWNACLYNAPIYSNNTIVNNNKSYYGGITTMADSATLINNIIWNNRGFHNDTIEQISWYCHADPPVVLYSDVMRGYEGEGNIDIDPRFVNPTIGCGIDYDATGSDFSLRNDSPLIGAGVPDTTGWNIPSTDFFGNPRIYGGRIDMGAIENQLVVSVRPLVKNEISFYLYPNPGTSTLKIKTALTGNNIQLHLNDVSGREILTQTVYNGKTVNVSRLKAGIYFYRLTAKNGTVLKTGKWVKL